MDDRNAFDLGSLNAIRLPDNPLLPPAYADPHRELGHVDLSGRPAPKNVRVQLNSGVEVRCEVRYHGINQVDGDRLFLVIAEIDWENYHPKTLIVEEAPSDVEYRFRIPGMTDDDAQAACAGLRLVPERIVYVK